MSLLDQTVKVEIDGRQRIGGSFRGASFFIESVSVDGGRNRELHEFPFSELDPFFEDINKKARVISVSGHVIGPNYIAARDKLEEALDGAGVGELVISSRGKMQCGCPSWNFSEARDEMRIARFTATFERASAKATNPSVTIDAPIKLNIAGDAALLALKASFLAKYDPTAVASDFLTPLEDIISGTAKALNSPGSDMISGVQKLADFRFRVNKIVNSAGAIVANALDAYSSTEDLLSYAFAPPTVPGPILAMLALIDMQFAKLPTVPVMTQSRTKQEELFVLLSKATRRQVLVKASRVAAEAEFRIFDDARQVRDQLLFRLEAELEDAADEDDIWGALSDVRDSVLDAIPNPTEQTQVRTTYTPKVTTPSILVSHALYGDTSRELEIVDRNNIRHPAFVMGGQPLEVVTGG